MENKKKDHTKKNIIIFIILLVLIVVSVVAAIILMSNPKETYTSSDVTSKTISALYCKSSNPNEPFFNPKDASQIKHELKITFENGKVGDMSYTFTGEFENSNATESALSSMRADYNLYLAGTSTKPEQLSPTFSNFGSTGSINLYIREDVFNSNTAKFMFLSSNEYSSFSKNTIDMLKKIYTGKGFNCQINN